MNVVLFFDYLSSVGYFSATDIMWTQYPMWFDVLDCSNLCSLKASSLDCPSLRNTRKYLMCLRCLLVCMAVF